MSNHRAEWHGIHGMLPKVEMPAPDGPRWRTTAVRPHPRTRYGRRLASTGLDVLSEAEVGGAAVGDTAFEMRRARLRLVRASMVREVSGRSSPLILQASEFQRSHTWNPS